MFGAGNRFHSFDIAVEHAVTNREGQRHIPVVARGVFRQFGLEIVQVVDQRLGDGIRRESGANVLLTISSEGLGQIVLDGCHRFSME